MDSRIAALNREVAELKAKIARLERLYGVNGALRLVKDGRP